MLKAISRDEMSNLLSSMFEDKIVSFDATLTEVVDNKPGNKENVFLYTFLENHDILRFVVDYKFTDVSLSKDVNICQYSKEDDLIKIVIDQSDDLSSYLLVYEVNLRSTVIKTTIDQEMFDHSDLSKQVEPEEVEDSASSEKREAMKRRIEKMLRLSQNNPSAEEAQTALLMAQKISVQYKIEMSNLATDDKARTIPKNAVSKMVSYEQHAVWKYGLLDVLCQNFRCYYYWIGPKTASVKYFVGGLPEDTEIVAMMYDFARNVAIECCARYIKERKQNEKKDKMKAYAEFIVQKQAMPEFIQEEDFEIRFWPKPDYKQMELVWYDGFVKGLKEKFKEQVNKEDWGLVLVMDAIVEQHKKDQKIKTVTDPARQRITKIDRKSYQNGFERGKNLTMHEHIE